MIPPSTTPVHVSGRCACGTITFGVSVARGEAPIFASYCHCDSCRRAHAAPLYQVVAVTAPMFRITAGEELLRSFTKTEGRVDRQFCAACGTRVLNRFPTWRPRGQEVVVFFPNLLDEAHLRPLPEVFRPRGHSYPEECVLDEAVLQALFAERASGAPPG